MNEAVKKMSRRVIGIFGEMIITRLSSIESQPKKVFVEVVVVVFVVVGVGVGVLILGKRNLT